jgi:hypothetical protein
MDIAEYSYCKIMKAVIYFDDFTSSGTEFSTLDNKFQMVVNHAVGSESCIWHKASTPKDLHLQPYMFGVQMQNEMDIKTIRIREGLKKKMTWYPH